MRKKYSESGATLENEREKTRKKTRDRERRVEGGKIQPKGNHRAGLADKWNGGDDDNDLTRKSEDPDARRHRRPIGGPSREATAAIGRKHLADGYRGETRGKWAPIRRRQVDVRQDVGVEGRDRGAGEERRPTG